ncbi:hypothetical protein EOD41_04935 [Mucilaginibacter limnophilus]|uniref:DUF4476 domain-containing protein n=1 Tax=Mucilaginibacter limnophilus TaxID=1932778 RepID=A0A3S2V284_9SPHI|nr:hypothetical protein [Mucilaginibacter limnophilus]RVU01313.1 hypothetical protein EOD41_04935 [Mucilaginibacter limnophilus]
MLKLTQKVSFISVMKLWGILLLCSTSALAQQKVEGIVFDRESKERIAQVIVRNTSTSQSVYNNLKAEFSIKAKTGDVIIFKKDGYYADTITVKDNQTLAIYLKRSGIQLKQVDITAKAFTPESKLEATKRDYTKIYGPAANPDFLTTSPYGGAGIGIDALYNAFSRSGRNAERLKEIIERDYEQDVIDYRYNRTIVGSITGLTGDKLTDFMQKFRPSYYFVTTASDYEFARRIRTDFRRYSRNPDGYGPQTFQPSK